MLRNVILVWIVSLFCGSNVCCQNQIGIQFINAEHTVTTGLSFPFINRIDSLIEIQSKAQPFAGVYKETMENIADQLQNMPPSFQKFIVKFEAAFAEHFLNPCNDAANNMLPKTSNWYCFFTEEKIPAWKQILLGANAHINADIWQALVKKSSADEIKTFKKPFLSLQSSIAKVHAGVFDTVLAHSRYLRVINFITVKQDKKLGERILYKWRKRNVNLAIWYFEHPEKFKRKWKQVQKKKKKIDRVILRSGPKN